MEVLIALLIIGAAMAISESSNHGHLDSLPPSLGWFFWQSSWENKYNFGKIYKTKYLWYVDTGKRLCSWGGLFYGMLVKLGLWYNTPMVAFTDAFHLFKTIWLAAFCYIIGLVCGSMYVSFGIYIVVTFIFQVFYGSVIPFLVKKLK